MKYIESNFSYLRETKLKKYYDELVKAECAVERFPRISKIIIRRVVEDLLRFIAKEKNIDTNICMNTLIQNIKFNFDFLFPQEIYNKIDIIRFNGNEPVVNNNISNRIIKSPIELLEITHNILCCYLKETEPQSMIKIKDLTFTAPTTIEYDRIELKKLRKEILLRKNKIDDLRIKVIELGNQSKSIRELTNIIIATREEKVNLESMEKILVSKINRYNIELVNLDENYEMYIKGFNQLKKECYDNNELLIIKEDQLLRAELENQEVRNLIKSLEEQDREIAKQVDIIDGQLEQIRKLYESSLNKSNTYQDIIETIEFSYDDKLKTELQFQKTSVKMEVEFEDRKFNEVIAIYNRNIDDLKRKIKIFKEILSEKIKKEIKFEEFYRGFLNLDGKQLRIIYSMIVNNKKTQVDKSKELLLKKVNEQSFNDSLNERLESLKNISDDNIRLFLYYKLIKVGDVRFGSMYNKRKFINTLDRMIEKSYGILTTEKEFRTGYNKLESIVMYYLEKVMRNLKNRYSNIQIHEELIDDIFNVIRMLNSCATEIIHNKIDVKSAPDDILKAAIKKEPFAFLEIIIDFAGIELYYKICNIIFKFSQLIVKSYSSSLVNNELSLLRFLNGPFLMLVFMSSEGPILNKKQDEKLLALIVMEILIVEFNSKDKKVDLIRYDKMVELWKHKQQKYNDIFIEKQDKEHVVKLLSKERCDLEIKYNKAVGNYNELNYMYNNYNEKFKSIVLNSNKGTLLSSYAKYIGLIDKKLEAENRISEAKSKLGTFKSVLSPELWKSHSDKIRSESEIVEAEKMLILEAKNSPHFQEEYQVFEKLKKEISKAKNILDEEKHSLDEKIVSINELKNKIDELDNQLNIIKDIYVDMEEGYY
ncbi:hypothetical protein CLOBY_03350 [Clostridium saccharobutylicum]|uniref:hypothetical protein n=1 Tax=Clostridium saccharobutylicum TaxID=169679 RepID=UPI000983A161|nr:hypothetical protein [Clostridium saccharobutylicum]AQS08265.1 hypothetical protein CLOBY_03350 [Clostridium saccharobutylicum]MBC2435849.1 hypothetical protein [Clostridium saccharobutylicum]NSB88371.1 hypothetical protein [Clostridium saccharobutylicum]NYC29409.1 hypothetical protein [Clostridium saccharobutylicum]OOM10937.1 hypothetical protein CLSAB_43220 [Clostridium saccharobutylicum]